MTEHIGLDVVYVAGPPGAGKTSVTEAYQEAYPHTEQFGTGELVWGIRDGNIDSRYSNILRKAARDGTSITDTVFSMLVHERIMRVKDSTETVMVTGFPHNYSDWGIFNESLDGSGIRAIGSVVLDADFNTCVARMQERDIKEGMDTATATSVKELLSYEKRYNKLVARLAIRLDCYKQAGLDIVTLSAERPRSQVLADFDDTIRIFKEKKVYNG